MEILAGISLPFNSMVSMSMTLKGFGSLALISITLETDLYFLGFKGEI